MDCVWNGIFSLGASVYRRDVDEETEHCFSLVFAAFLEPSTVFSQGFEGRALGVAAIAKEVFLSAE